MNKKVFSLALPLLFLSVALLGILFYLCTFYVAKDVDDFLVGNERVAVQKTSYGYLFDGEEEENALVFYPGARVEETAYAPLLFELAENGVDCYLMKMPFHMAIFRPSAAEKVVDESHSHWYVGGHSLGGTIAAQSLLTSSFQADGIILFASYTEEDLSSLSLKTLSLYGSEDKIVNQSKLQANQKNFSDYTETIIEGGNHSQFGSYGLQYGDGEAKISSEEQIEKSVQAILALLGEK